MKWKHEGRIKSSFFFLLYTIGRMIWLWRTKHRSCLAAVMVFYLTNFSMLTYYAVFGAWVLPWIRCLEM